MSVDWISVDKASLSDEAHIEVGLSGGKRFFVISKDTGGQVCLTREEMGRLAHLLETGLLAGKP